MSMDITLLKNNSNENKSDLEWVEEFHKFLQGELPGSIKMKRKLKLSPKEAMSVISYLQEHFSILPDTIEMCVGCEFLFDSNSEGVHDEDSGNHYCDSCQPIDI